MYSDLIEKLVKQLQCFPGIGPKSARRTVFHLLQYNRQGGLAVAELLKAVMNKVDYCQRCKNFTEDALCVICKSNNREDDLLCVVESPSDVVAIEQTFVYKGYYFVLKGALSPLRGQGAEEIGINNIIKYIDRYQPKEIILATSSTVEGETTAHYLSEILKDRNIKMTRIAHGIPFGHELELTDGRTLRQAFSERKHFNAD